MCMELKLENGDYVPDGAGGLQCVQSREALLQRVLYKLTARRGQFPFLEDLGSRLWQLGQVSPAKREAAAAQYVAEALSDEPELQVQDVALAYGALGAELTAELSCGDQTLTVQVQVQ